METEEKEDWNWALWDPTQDKSGGGQIVTEANIESLICQIESEPLQGCVLDPHPLLQTREWHAMISCHLQLLNQKVQEQTKSLESAAKNILLENYKKQKFKLF